MSTDTVRPAPPADPTDPGFAWVAVAADTLPSNRWRLASGRQCRQFAGNPRRRCENPAVAAVNRGLHRWRSNKTFDSWWHYCADHLYGRWIENGVLMIWILRPVGEIGNGGDR